MREIHNRCFFFFLIQILHEQKIRMKMIKIKLTGILNKTNYLYQTNKEEKKTATATANQNLDVKQFLFFCFFKLYANEVARNIIKQRMWC